MSCILDILSKEELIRRKENLLKELNKVDNEIKKRDNFTLHISDLDNTLLNVDLILNNEELNMTSIELSNTFDSSTYKCSNNSQEPNKKISKIKLKKTNNLQDNNESVPLYVEILKDNISPKLKIKGSIKINIKKI